ncbi:HlyD family type I secretion periplasmic adaptor subunit [Parvularcula sp. IMCC14364]|uniref:HlyD family type I secretion periplasmic adaptor subunit n=1 Tax=Parvularcula sp. IMCC14364 TaxID=3067902 RepID=UPI002740DBBF|nr:HlyD family type I secretion periplasmic adaptor subunit [Parvularcula sp. IMCC14364]
MREGEQETDFGRLEEHGIVGHNRLIAKEGSVQLLYTIALFLLIFLVWASVTSVDRVTRGSGRVVSQERNNFVQHYEGGIIKQILVSEGERIEEGATLVRIENSFAQAELDSSTLELSTLRIRASRLRAESEGLAEINFSEELASGFPDQIIQETTYFSRRREGQAEVLSVIDEQIEQKELELSERRSHLANLIREQELMSERLISLRELSGRGAISRNELLQDETQYQQIVTQVSNLEFQIPQTEAGLAEVKARRRESESRFRSEAQRELRETEVKIELLDERISALQDRSQRFDVTAPTSGVINKLFVNNIDGVVRPGQNIAEIVPDNAAVEIEAKLLPSDRAQIWPGLPVIAKISAYDFSTFGGLPGKILEISPDALVDDDGNVYFRVRIEAETGDLGEDTSVVPGMQAEVDILTGKQTILSYLLRPVQNIRENAFRE